MKLEEISAVKMCFDEKDINEHLAKGYKIIKILSSKTTNANSDVVQPIFVMGLEKK